MPNGEGQSAASNNTLGAPPLLSVISAVFNEEEGVAELVRRLTAVCRTLGSPFEVIIVNDGSRDSTLQRLVTMSRDISELRIIDLLRNFGVMSALTAGLAAARGNAVVVIDGDLQDPPEIIPQFMKSWKEGADVVYGQRTQREEAAPLRAMIAIYYWLQSRLSDISIPAQSGNFCLIDRRVADLLLAMPEKHRYFSGLRSWVGGRQVAVTYRREERQFGKTRQGLRGLFRHARLGIVSFSKMPLRLVSLLSMVFALFLLGVSLAAVVIRLGTDAAIPGWATYTGLIGGMGFVHSLALSVISEYLATIFDEVKNRPVYLVRDEFSGGEPVASSRLRA